MKIDLRFIIFFFLIFTFNKSLNAQQSKKEYLKEIKEWDQKRLESLKSANGWVNLAGLFWLKKGPNTFGSDSLNDVIFNHPNFPARLGVFIVKENEVKWVTNADNKVLSLGKQIDEMVVYNIDSAKAPSLSFATFKWNIIKREEKIGIRFRDLNNPALSMLSHINRYEVDKKWKVKAIFEQGLLSTIAITNVLGQTTQQASPGKIVFEIAGKKYKLDVLDEGPGDLFVIFGDETNGVETYHTGRFIYISRPDENGNTFIDFNKAHNPPCAFTTFATCPIPPRQNILPIAIYAGEKNVHF